MNLPMLQKYFIAVLLLFAAQQLDAIIVHARMLEKRLASGITQRVYLFGDFHTWWFNHSAEKRKKINERSWREQQQIIDCAKELNAMVLVEDLLENEPDEDLFYQMVLTLPRLITQAYLYFFAAQSYLVHLTRQCQTHNVAVVNIEARHNLALLGGVQNFFWVVSQLDGIYRDSPRTITMLNNLYRFCLLSATYGAYRQYATICNNAENSRFASKILKHWQNFNDLYALEWFTGRINSWVDVKALTTILDNPAQEVFFVCAGDAHCLNLEDALLAEGYVLKDKVIDPLAVRTYGMQFDLNNYVIVDTFVKATMRHVIKK